MIPEVSVVFGLTDWEASIFYRLKGSERSIPIPEFLLDSIGRSLRDKLGQCQRLAIFSPDPLRGIAMNLGRIKAFRKKLRDPLWGITSLKELIQSHSPRALLQTISVILHDQSRMENRGKRPGTAFGDSHPMMDPPLNLGRGRQIRGPHQELVAAVEIIDRASPVVSRHEIRTIGQGPADDEV